MSRAGLLLLLTLAALIGCQHERPKDYCAPMLGCEREGTCEAQRQRCEEAIAPCLAKFWRRR
jgi:hypothetical protein